MYIVIDTCSLENYCYSHWCDSGMPVQTNAFMRLSDQKQSLQMLNS